MYIYAFVAYNISNGRSIFLDFIYVFYLSIHKGRRCAPAFYISSLFKTFCAFNVVISCNLLSDTIFCNFFKILGILGYI